MIDTNTPAKPAYKLITVDVWDTLLRRRCHPESVKLHLCCYLLNLYSRLLPASYRDQWKLLQARQQAEKSLADLSRENGFDDEYQHLDVYRRWLELIQFDFNGLAPELRGEFSAILERIELDQEHYVTYPDPMIRELLDRYDASRILFLSDFYMPASHLKQLLLAHGLDELVPAGVVSCELMLNKKSGRLFKQIHDTYEIRPEEHLHIGDNPWADVESPRKLGIETVHYIPEHLHKKRTEVEKAFHDRKGFLRGAIQKLTEDTQQTAQPDEPKANFFYNLGKRSSLLFFAFSLDIMERAAAGRIEKLFFFTREGEFFLNLYQQIQKQDTLGYPVPESLLLEVSRIATFAGSLREFTTAELMRLWNLYSTQSLAGLFASLDIDATPFIPMLTSHGFELQEPIRYPWLDQRIQKFFADGEFQESIRAVLHEKKRVLLSYLASQDLPGNHSTVGIVDIGWRGTIQDNLAYLFPDIEIHGFYFALNRFLNIQPPNCTKSALGPNLNAGASPWDFLLDSISPMEMLCNSPSGSVQGYFLADEGVQVSKRIDPSENLVHDEYVRYFQQGVIDSMAYWADLSRTHAYAADELKPLALRIWGDLVEKPDPALARAFFELNHNELFGVGTFVDKSQLPGLESVLLYPVSARHRKILDKFIREMGWPAGFFANPDIGDLYRTVMKGFMGACKMKATACRKLDSIIDALKS